MNLFMMLRVLWNLQQLRPHDAWTRPQLEGYQASALDRLREYTYQHSPFYQRFHRGLTDRPLQELPVLTKEMLMEHFDEVVTDRTLRLADVEAHLTTLQGDERFRGRYWVTATSGSTGRRGIFLFNEGEWAMILASFARGHEWAGTKIDLSHRMKMASVASTAPWHMSARVGATLDSRWMPALRLDASTPLDTLVAQLNAWQPNMLVAYPSIARLLADEQMAGRLAITPDLLFTSSEVLTEETRRRIEDAWGQRLLNEYGATECGLLAAESDQHRGLLLAEDLTLVEVVDQKNRPVPPGEYGDKLLITVLFNHTQPLIRYELSDSIKLAQTPDASGRPYRVIEAIQGRSEDILHFPARAGGWVEVHPIVLHRLLDIVPASGWQVVQTPEGLQVLLSGLRADFAEEPLEVSLRRDLEAQGALVPIVSIQRVEALPRGATGKVSLIHALPVSPLPALDHQASG